MAEVIRGKVARVLNSHEVAINVGSQCGVAVGMDFDIVDETEEIRDPDTNQVLGFIGRPKVRVKVIRVQERLSLATTYKTRKVNIGGQGLGSEMGPLSKAFLPQEWIAERETIKTEERTWDDIDETENYVKTGDAVVQVIAETEEALPAA